MKLKKTLPLLLCLFLASSVWAQDVEQCKNVADKFFTAVSNHSTEGLADYLAPDFRMAGYGQPMATTILNQLIPQINETVNDYEIVEQQAADDSLVLKYKVNYKGMGEKEATFIFNSDNLVKECELIKVQVQAITVPHAAPTAPIDTYVAVPFKLHHDIPMVTVTVDGKECNFLVDSGAPAVMLNSEYFESTLPENATTASSGHGVVSSAGHMGMHKVETFDLGGITLTDQDIVTTDFSNLSTRREKIYGLIGYSFFQSYDVLFDYVKKELVFLNPAYTDLYLMDNGYNADWMPIRMHQHIAGVTCTIDGDTLEMGFDCGAQANLLDVKFFESHRKAIKGKGHDQLGGVGEGMVRINTGKLNVTVGNKEIARCYTAFSDMAYISGAIGIDGLIGYQVLKKNRLLVSFTNQQMTFINK